MMRESSFFSSYIPCAGNQKIKIANGFFLNIFVSNNNEDIMLWHFWLGHPSFRYLKHLFPKFVW
uniref:GAG-pre-integrase domain-containing protein n=1 Tax=Cajanus cajan TaxID=3821 RepID=A0A151TFJ8_CAJCA|nr:hypothetical protein KK1_012088 [Cajanus cajan]